MQEYGTIIKKLRKDKKYTLKQLSEKTGLSVGFLSKIEHCTSNLSYSNLQKICFALDVPSSVFESNEYVLSRNLPALLKQENRSLIYLYEGGVKLESLFSNQDLFEITIMTLTGDDCPENIAKHPLNEFGIILTGTLCTTIDGVDYIANPQECMLIPKETIHSTKKIGKTECVSIWIRYR